MGNTHTTQEAAGNSPLVESIGAIGSLVHELKATREIVAEDIERFVETVNRAYEEIVKRDEAPDVKEEQKALQEAIVEFLDLLPTDTAFQCLQSEAKPDEMGHRHNPLSWQVCEIMVEDEQPDLQEANLVRMSRVFDRFNNVQVLDFLVTRIEYITDDESLIYFINRYVSTGEESTLEAKLGRLFLELRARLTTRSVNRLSAFHEFVTDNPEVFIKCLEALDPQKIPPHLRPADIELPAPEVRRGTADFIDTILLFVVQRHDLHATLVKILTPQEKISLLNAPVLYTNFGIEPPRGHTTTTLSNALMLWYQNLTYPGYYPV